MTLPGLDERFMVGTGRITLTVPVHIDEGIGDVELVVAVSYQACDDVSCLAPAEARTPIG